MKARSVRALLAAAPAFALALALQAGDSRWINLRRAVIVPAIQPEDLHLGATAETGTTEPLSLGCGDFDRDGVSDLVVGSRTDDTGRLNFYRGSSKSMVGDSPFLSTPTAVDLSEPPDFIGVGDFDADGYLDVVTAASGGRALQLLAGDGRGQFSPSRRIELAGMVTALVVGEMNRADGLMDVIVGLQSDERAMIAVFTGPDGALQTSPRTLSLPGEGVALGLGQWDDDHLIDLAVATAREVVIVHGGDDAISSLPVPFEIRSLVLGDFVLDAEHRTEAAILSADRMIHLLDHSGSPQPFSVETTRFPSSFVLVRSRLSGLPTDDLLILDPVTHQIHLLAASYSSPVSLDVSGEAMAVLPMRLNGDALSDLIVLQKQPLIVTPMAAQTFVVTTGVDFVPGSLREAIQNANANSGMDTINFAIPGLGLHTIQPTQALPVITEAVIIDGNSQLGLITISGALAGNADGLTITGGNSLVRGLTIHHFNGHGIVLSGNGNNFVRGCFIGTNGNVAWSNTKSGIFVQSADNTIGGTTIADRNVISGNTDSGIVMAGPDATDNKVQGNFIGTDMTGSSPIANASGVTIHVASSNTIGGSAAGEGNVISGNSGRGVAIKNTFFPQKGPNLNLVQGNFIGTNAAGTSKLANGAEGVYVYMVPANTIGGTSPTARNILSGNVDGVYIDHSSGQFIQRNFIGTDINGQPLGNSENGIVIRQSAHGTIERNVVSGNGKKGLRIEGNLAHDNAVFANFIGTDSTGTLDVGNAEDGIFIDGAEKNLIGGTGIERNVISGNDHNGVNIVQGEENLVFGNNIGSDVNGTTKLPNERAGVRIEQGADNTIGSPGNLISGNAQRGVLILASDQKVISNRIGTAAFGMSALGNQTGIGVYGSSNQIAQNQISGNDIGVFVGAGEGNRIEKNKIGIDGTGTAPLSNGIGVLIESQSGIAKKTEVLDNVIAGNESADVEIRGDGKESGTRENRVFGNEIGTDATGTIVLSAGKAGQVGVLIVDSPDNAIGGSENQGWNLISGHFVGVHIKGAGASGNVVEQNYIGTDHNGTSSLPNYIGVFIEDAPQNIVGDSFINLISGNEWGVWIHGPAASGNRLQWNVIGAGHGSGPYPGNLNDGVVINSAPENTIESNFITGNLGNGVHIVGGLAILNQIKSNWIGTDDVGHNLGNGRSGVLIAEGASKNTIGGGAPEEKDNLIGFNGLAGISIEGKSSERNGIFSNNSIYSNALLGIDLSFDGITPNDSLAVDIDSGPNQLQNYPFLTAAGADPTTTTVYGALTSTPNSTFILTFFSSPVCDPSGFGEGKTFVGSIQVGTASSGIAVIAHTLPLPTPQGHYITATATDVWRNTSEFSKCVAVGVRRQ